MNGGNRISTIHVSHQPSSSAPKHYSFNPNGNNVHMNLNDRQNGYVQPNASHRSSVSTRGPPLIPPPHAPSVVRSHHDQNGSSIQNGSDVHATCLANYDDNSMCEQMIGGPNGTLRSIAASTSSNITRLTDPITQREIKFTKTEGCTPSTCICLLLAIVLIMMGASSGIYFGREYLLIIWLLSSLLSFLSLSLPPSSLTKSVAQLK